MVYLVIQAGFLPRRERRKMLLFTVNESPVCEEEPQQVYCSICGTDYVHPEAVKSFPLNRGTCIEVLYWCENHHYFAVRQTFHKGQIFVSVERLPDWTDENAPSEMWRD